MSAGVENDSRHRIGRRERAILLLILLGGLAVRVYLASTAGICSRDTCTFVWLAQDLQTEGLRAVRDCDQHPLYSLIIAGTHAVLGPAGLLPPGNAGWERAAVISSCAAGLACIVAAWAFARYLFGPRIALVTALFAAVLPEMARYSADGLSDPLHLTLYLFALLLGVSGLARGSWRLLLGAGFCAGLAFLTRPEGAGPAVVLVPACLAAATGRDWRRRLIAAAAVAVGFAVPALPYMITTGTLVQKKPIEQLVPWFNEQEPQAGADRPAHQPENTTALAGALVVSDSLAGRFAEAVVVIVRKWIRTCRIVYFFLALAGIAVYRWPKNRYTACAVITAAGLLHFVLLVLLVINFNYARVLSQRHTLILVALILPWSAAGTEWVVREIHQRLRRPVSSLEPPASFWTAVLLCVTVPTSYWLFRPLHPGDGYFRLAGEWLAANRPHAQLVMTTEPRVPFYADKPMQRWPAEGGQLSELIAHLDAFKPSILALDVHCVTHANPAFLDEVNESVEARRRLQRIASFSAPGAADDSHQVILFDVVLGRARGTIPQPPQ